MKKHKNNLILLILVVCVGIWGIVFYFSYQSFSRVAESTPQVVEDIDNSRAKRDLIRVSSPAPQTSIQSPLIVQGEARGMWFFEASFPISIILADGTVVGKGIAQAKDEWMTENFVPFEATVEFSKPLFAEKGFLKLMKDNPSGDPSHDDALIIPIRFQ